MVSSPNYYGLQEFEILDDIEGLEHVTKTLDGTDYRL